VLILGLDVREKKTPPNCDMLKSMGKVISIFWICKYILNVYECLIMCNIYMKIKIINKNGGKYVE
jgi:hypothetical protein